MSDYIESIDTSSESKNDVEIFAHDWVEEKLFSDLVQQLGLSNDQAKINIIKSEHYSVRGFNGSSYDLYSPVIEIYLFIQNDRTAFIVGSVIGPLFYDALKLIWQKISSKALFSYKLIYNWMTTRKENVVEVNERCLFINFSLDNKKIEFELRGNKDDPRLIKSFDLINQILLESQKSQDKESKPVSKIKYRFNKKKQKWEPVNKEKIAPC